MIKKKLYDFYKTTVRQTDWKLLLFLLLFLNVKLIIKVLAVILIYVLRPDFRLGFNLRSPRLPWFYIIVIAISLVNLLLYGLYSNMNYDIAFLTGISFWVLCVLAIHQIKLSVENSSAEKIHNALLIFFVLNAFFSFGNLFQIIIETGAINPYQYQGMFQKYFIGTGDNIRGLPFDTSTTNAIINAFGVIYFLKRTQAFMALLCITILLLTGSNLTNILIITVLVCSFIFRSTKDQKSIIAISLLFIVIFMAKISPQNDNYAEDFFKNHFSKKNISTASIGSITILSPEEQKRKIAQDYIDSEYCALQGTVQLAAPVTKKNAQKPSVPKPNIHSREYQNINLTTASQKELIGFAKQNHLDPIVLTIKDDWQKKPGKLISMQQTASYFFGHPLKMFTGNGIGNFSSRLAFRTTGLKVAGSYPAKYAYIDSDFEKNHLAVFLYYFTKQTELHSVTNTPDSVYNQLAGEYGLMGITAFLLFYIGFFVKRMKDFFTALPLLFIMLSVFAIGYWFEQLSIVPFFELLMFLNFKENKLS